MDDRKRYRCKGGPWNGHYLWLGTHATAVLRFANRIGRYVADKQNKQLKWEKVDAQ